MRPPIPILLNLDRATISCAEREGIVNQLDFLKQHQNSIHSIVVVGSTACNARARGSDIDVVIITTTGGHEKICSVVFEKEIAEALNGDNASRIEYTILSPAQTEELFQLSSPFAQAIRYGSLIHDDGYLLLLRNRRFPALPGKEYYTTTLRENIATQYYGTLKKLQANVREKCCSPSCCRDNSGCDGLQPTFLFANLIMRMFYVTLPSRGMIPLTKNDVVSYAKKAYGSQGEKIAKDVVSLMRDPRLSLYYDDFRILKKFAVQMFREIVRIIGRGSETLPIIRDAAKITRGDYQRITDRALKNCVA